MIKRLNMKDFITIGVLTVLMFVLSMVISAVTMFSLQFAYIGGTAFTQFFLAFLFLVLVFRVRKPGTVLIMCIIHAVIYLLMGTPQMLLTLIPAGIISELILAPKNGYHSVIRATVCWSVFSAMYSLHGAIILWVFGTSFTDSEVGKTMFTEESLNLIMSYYTNPWIILLIIVLNLVFAALGCFFGWKLMKKHFIKSGYIKS